MTVSVVEDFGIPLPPEEFILAVGGGDFHATGKHFFDIFMKHCGVLKNATVLDIGSGCGRLANPFTNYLTSAGSYHGIDVVKPMVDWCTQEITSRYSNFHFHHADLTNTLYNEAGLEASGYRFPFTDNTFDFVWLTSVFTHLNPEDTRNYLAEIYRVLKPGGRVFMTYYIINNEYRRNRVAERAFVTFDHGEAPYWVHNADVPEAVSAYDEAYLFDAIRSTSLEIITVSYGGWNRQPGWSFQDAVLAWKRAD